MLEVLRVVAWVAWVLARTRVRISKVAWVTMTTTMTTAMRILRPPLLKALAGMLLARMEGRLRARHAEQLTL